LRRFSVASKREAVHTQQNLILKMKAAVKLDKDAHSEGEMQEAMNKLEVLRDKLHKARRTAQGLPQKTREQRLKVREMEAANVAAPGTHSEDEISAETLKLRELMSKWSKRSLVRPSKQSKHNKDGAGSAVEILKKEPLV
jgi:hypothetical protein